MNEEAQSAMETENPVMTPAATAEAPAKATTPRKRAAAKKAAPTTAPATGRGAPMTDEHKQALAEGREHSRVVRSYLEALESHKPRRGRKRTPESIQNRLASIERDIPMADPLARLNLIQEKANLEAELAAMTGESTVDMSALEDAFVGVASAYGERRGISYATWREAGVDASVLKRAGISRAV